MEKIIATNNLKLLRIKAGHSQHSLAEMAKVTPGTISRIENGITGANPRTAKAISEILEFSFDQLFEIIEEGAGENE